MVPPCPWNCGCSCGPDPIFYPAGWPTSSLERCACTACGPVVFGGHRCLITVENGKEHFCEHRCQCTVSGAEERFCGHCREAMEEFEKTRLAYLRQCEIRDRRHSEMRARDARMRTDGSCARSRSRSRARCVPKS